MYIHKSSWVVHSFNVSALPRFSCICLLLYFLCGSFFVSHRYHCMPSTYILLQQYSYPSYPLVFCQSVFSLQFSLPVSASFFCIRAPYTAGFFLLSCQRWRIYLVLLASIPETITNHKLYFSRFCVLHFHSHRLCFVSIVRTGTNHYFIKLQSVSDLVSFLVFVVLYHLSLVISDLLLPYW